VILVSAYLCLHASTSSQKLIESRAEVAQSARVALAMMTADLRAACVLSKEIEFLGVHRTLRDIEADNLDFATHNYSPRRPREGDYCGVSYFVDKSRESNQWSLWRRRNPTISPDPLSGGVREEIATGLRGLRMEYYDGLEWYDEWGETKDQRPQRGALQQAYNLSGLPEAVRITLWFDPNPRATAAAAAATGVVSEPSNKEPAEPPLVFQTVVRINLSATSQPMSSSSSDTSTNSPTGGPANNPGGNPGGPL
jgi:hypothetical protein